MISRLVINLPSQVAGLEPAAWPYKLGNKEDK